MGGLAPSRPRMVDGAHAFSDAEVGGLVDFHAAWTAALDVVPDVGSSSLRDIQSTHEWRHLADEAARVLTVFAIRGRLSENEEHG